MRILLMSLLVAASAGCATTMNDSAPGPQPGTIIVVGSKQGRPAMWQCPEKAGVGECRLLEVEVEE